SLRFSKGRTAILFSGRTARAAASGDDDTLVSSGASWRERLQIPNPIASATVLRRAAVNTGLRQRFVSEESATSAVCSGTFELNFAGSSASAISSGSTFIGWFELSRDV